MAKIVSNIFGTRFSNLPGKSYLIDSTAPSRTNRILSIDILRGIIMIIMALDHVRQYFHIDSFYFSPTDLSKADSATFWTRFITHFCAPLFILLAGISARILGQRRTAYELTKWLFTRGLWLILLEVTVVKFVTLFNLNYEVIVLQVIWVIGIAMIFLSFFLHLPLKVGLCITIVGLVAHHLIEYVPMGDSTFWTFLYQFKIILLGNVEVFVAYPIVPWIFVMTLGYYIGGWFSQNYSLRKRRRGLQLSGIVLIGVFLTLRFMNGYGDPVPWELGSTSYSINSFFNVSKYPPSLLYLAITLGPGLIGLSLLEDWRNGLSQMLALIGRVPMFYYVLHFLVIHILATGYALFLGYGLSDMIIDVWITAQSQLKGFGVGLPTVYFLWVLVICIMYPLCRWFDRIKNRYYGQWWVSFV